MVKPVILAVDDDRQVLRAVERDLQRKDTREYRVLRADPGESVLDKLPSGDPTPLSLVTGPLPATAGRSRSTPGWARGALWSVC